MGKMFYEDRMDLIYGGITGREMLDAGMFGEQAVSEAVELGDTPEQPETESEATA
jgi:hypothetical protein